MSIFLAGVPGRLKTLLDRLTSTRAGYLDNLDAAVTSVYDSGNWTGTKAGYLDAAVSSAGVKPQTGLYTQLESASATMYTAAGFNTAPGRYVLSGALTGGAYATIINITGSGGYLYFAGVATVDTTARVVSIKITVDGTAALEKTSASISAADRGIIAVGCGLSTGWGLGAIRFTTSLKIEIKSDLSETDKVYLKASYSLD